VNRFRRFDILYVALPAATPTRTAGDPDLASGVTDHRAGNAFTHHPPVPRPEDALEFPCSGLSGFGGATY